jgi:hypothetical protein
MGLVISSPPLALALVKRGTKSTHQSQTRERERKKERKREREREREKERKIDR